MMTSNEVPQDLVDVLAEGPPSQPQAPDDPITSDQVRERYALPYTTIQAWTRRRKVHVWKMGRTNVYSESEIRRLVEETRTIRPADPPRTDRTY
jgi:hypothetical protein